MSRIGKNPVPVPSGVACTLEDHALAVKGPKGELSRTFSPLVVLSQEGETIVVSAVDDSREANAQHGLTRTLVHNMVVGVSEGFEKRLQLVGVGYRAQLKGRDLELALGYSHPVKIVAPEGVSFEVPDNTHVTVKGVSKEKVGQVAADIRAKRPPEPYKGKGVRYVDEHVRRKLGKAAK